MIKDYWYSDKQFHDFFEDKVNRLKMKRSSLIRSLVEKWLFGNLDVAKEYEIYVKELSKKRAVTMRKNHWKNYSLTKDK